MFLKLFSFCFRFLFSYKKYVIFSYLIVIFSEVLHMMLENT